MIRNRCHLGPSTNVQTRKAAYMHFTLTLVALFDLYKPGDLPRDRFFLFLLWRPASAERCLAGNNDGSSKLSLAARGCTRHAIAPPVSFGLIIRGRSKRGRHARHRLVGSQATAQAFPDVGDGFAGTVLLLLLLLLLAAVHWRRPSSATIRRVDEVRVCFAEEPPPLPPPTSKDSRAGAR